MNARITLSIADCFRVFSLAHNVEIANGGRCEGSSPGCNGRLGALGSLISRSVLVLRANSLITNRSFVRLLSSISSRTMFASTRLSVHYGRVVHAKQA